MQTPILCLMFDREGGALARFGMDYWHGYDDMERLAADFFTYVDTGATLGLPRNEKNDYEWPEPDRWLVERGQAVWFDYAGVMQLATVDKELRFGDIDAFLTAVRRKTTQRG